MKKLSPQANKRVKEQSSRIWNEQKKTMPYIGVAYWMLETPSINKIISERISKSKDPVETWYQEVLVRAWELYNKWLTEDTKRFSEKIAQKHIRAYVRKKVYQESRPSQEELVSVLEKKKKEAILERPDKTGKSAGRIAERIRQHRTFIQKTKKKSLEDILFSHPSGETIAERIKQCRAFTEKKGDHAGHKTRKIPLHDDEACEFKHTAWELGNELKLLYCETCNKIYGWEAGKRESHTFRSVSHYYQRVDEADDYIPSTGENVLHDDSEGAELEPELEQHEVVKEQLIGPLLSEPEGHFPVIKLQREVQEMIEELTTADERGILRQHLVQQLSNEKIGMIWQMSKEGVRKALLRIIERLLSPSEQLEIVRKWVIWRRGKRLAKRDFPHWPWKKK